eukprot:g1312.t1
MTPQEQILAKKKLRSKDEVKPLRPKSPSASANSPPADLPIVLPEAGALSVVTPGLSASVAGPDLANVEKNGDYSAAWFTATWFTATWFTVTWFTATWFTATWFATTWFTAAWFKEKVSFAGCRE